MQSWTPPAEDGLRLLLNEWDPIGVADDVPDEYDCLLAPLLQRLRLGHNQADIGQFLRRELVEHFGLDPLGLRHDAMAARVMAWWTSAAPVDGMGSS
ncbi:MAG TPA: hypothetical protein VFH94_15320 [Streptomyces sp.]|nr:hypothetical protein [Streptomyces sp.]